MEEAVLINRRRRRHRSAILNDIEAELRVLKEQHSENMGDTSLCRRETGFKQVFLTHET